MFLKMFAIVAILFAGAVSADNSIIPLPVCKIPGQNHVDYYATRQSFLNNNGGSIAMAGRNPANGRYYIAYDQAAFQTFPDAFQRWILAHECAHHQLGHTQHPYHTVPREKAKRDEDAADCAAAAHLADLSDRDWHTITSVMGDDERIRKFTGIPKHIDQDMFGYHSENAKRVATVKQCLQKARR